MVSQRGCRRYRWTLTHSVSRASSRGINRRTVRHQYFSTTRLYLCRYFSTARRRLRIPIVAVGRAGTSGLRCSCPGDSLGTSPADTEVHLREVVNKTLDRFREGRTIPTEPGVTGTVEPGPV